MRERRSYVLCVKAYNHAINDDEITFMFILNTTKAKNMLYMFDYVLGWM